MPAVANYPSGSNTFVPSPKSTGFLMTGFSRNAKDFPVNKFLEVKPPVEKDIFEYGVMNTANASRVMGPNGEEFLWIDGQMAPAQPGNVAAWYWLADRTQRYVYAYTLGQKAVDQADWDILGSEGRFHAQQAMTHRELLVYNALGGASWGANAAAVNNGICPSGQDWANGTSLQPNFLLSLNYAALQIRTATLGRVGIKDLRVVLGPKDATILAACPEIRDYMKGSVYSAPALRGDDPYINQEFGLPPKYNGFELVIDDAVITTSAPGAASLAQGFIWAKGTSYMIAREGALEGIGGGPSFSTVHMYYYKDEMTVESKYDSDNRLYQGRIISDYKIVIPNVLSGFKFTATTTAFTGT